MTDVSRTNVRSRPARTRASRRRRLVAGLAVLGLLLAGSTPSAGQAVPIRPEEAASGPALSPADRRAMAEQAPYLVLDEKVRKLASTVPATPLAGVSLDTAHRRMTVYWAGKAPAELDDLRVDAHAQGIRMAIVPAVHSERELMAAASQLARTAESTRTQVTVDIHTDGSGLTVRGQRLGTAARDRRLATPEYVQLFRAMAVVADRTGVTVNAADEAGFVAQPAARGDDVSPHWAGALTRNSTSGCTSGFSMYATGAATRFMLTAAHCSDWRDGVATSNGAGTRMGVTDFVHELFDAEPRYDLGVIRLDAEKSNLPRMYLSDTSSAVVRGMAGGVPAGGNYCISGSVGTPNCNIISQHQVLICANWVPFGRCYYAVRFTSKTGGYTTCRGDSGGPIYYWNGDGIIAAGISSGGYFRTDDERCAAEGVMSVVASAVNRYNISGLRVLTP